MESLQIKTRTAADGRLNLTVPTELPETDVEVTVVYSPVSPVPKTDENGWPEGFFEQTAGSIPDLERPHQGEYEIREDTDW